ncbi:MAG: galactose-1-phosphate uridylyltransferase [Bacilli bacterium]|nr:galactose-1-phosphate uridylyltransferase [Bacilli bacterium]
MIENTVKKLIIYAKRHLFLQESDLVYAENMVLGYLGCLTPSNEPIDEDAIEAMDVPDALVEELIEELKKQGIEANEAERKAVYVLGLLSPRPSTVQDVFTGLYQADPKEATEYLYALSVANYYVRKTQIDKNILFNAKFEQGSDLEVSINLSKPEKKNSDIAKLLVAKSTSYPLCLLCPENLGFYGQDRHPARGNLRYVELPLEGRTWYLQFSPYGYFDRHCILFQKEHEPMVIDRRIFATLLAFVDAFPHYFMGSNADLPIVGGSILNHEHFQGGAHLLPVMRAPVKKVIPTKDASISLGVLDFYNTSLLLKSKDKQRLLDAAEKMLRLWRGYDDAENQILHGDEKNPHNTITALARKVGEEYLLYLILRNNRCDETYPDGIFHVHPERSHIKSEGIGLIEASGLFILPARLKRQGKQVEDVIARNLDHETALKEYPDIEPFFPMIEKMKKDDQSLEQYLGNVCQNILNDVAVFKNDERGRVGLMKFLEACDL